MKDLTIKYVSVDKIKPYKHNAKIHTTEQIQQIMESIKQFGFNDPIAIDEDNEIIEGHGRLLAAMHLGLETVPTIKIEGLTDQQKKAYILAHNQLTINTGFDLDILNDELKRITEFNMEDFGFETIELLSDEDFDALFTDEVPTEKKPKQIQCPHCGEWFEVRK